jgi:GntR family transcriptional regulator
MLDILKHVWYNWLEIYKVITNLAKGKPVVVDRSSPLPLYHQIKQTVLEWIERGQYLPGELIPPERDLAEKFEVSRITVRRAIEDLTREGLFVRIQGKGTFVAPLKVSGSSKRVGGFVDELRLAGFETTELKVIEIGMVPCPSDAARRLHIDEGSIVLYLYRLARADDEPIATAVVYLAVGESVSVNADELDRHESIYSFLEKEYGFHFTGGEKIMEAVGATPEEAAILGIEERSPVFLSRLTIWGQSKSEPIAYAKVAIRGDRYKYRMEIGR